MHTRILEIRKFYGLSQEEFSHIIGIKRSTLSGIEINRAPITERTTMLICSKFNINEKWLKTGKGEMLNKVDKKYDEFFEIYNNLQPALQDFLIKTAENLLDTQERL